MQFSHFPLAFAIFVLKCSDVLSQYSHSNPGPLSGGEALIFPEERISENGSLSFTLTVDVSDITYDWLTIHRRVYDGKIPGPTWRVKRGDTVNVTLKNMLTNPQKEGPLNDLRLPNSTNLHTHGLHISSKEPEDNVFVEVPPQGQYVYSYSIDPENPAGTYWYHPHVHGSTILQVHGGLAGMIIVEDPAAGPAAPPAELAAVSCPDNCDHEVPLLFQPLLKYRNRADRGYANLQRDIEDDENFRHTQYSLSTGAANLEEWLEDNVNNVDHYTVNGQLFPILTIPAGQLRRFRMVNAAGSETLELMIVESGSPTTATTGCSFREIAFDGVYLDEAREARLGKTVLVPSGKGDWLVVCNVPGSYELRSVPDNADSRSMGNFQRHNGLLLSINVTGLGTAETTIPRSLPTRESFVQDFRNLTQDEVRGRFVIEASPGTRLNRERFSSEKDYRFKSELGTVQEWYLTNADTNLGHPIHLHINHFQIVSYNQYTGPIAAAQGPNLMYYSQSLTECFHQHSRFGTGPRPPVPRNALQYLGHDTRAAAGGAGTLGYVALGEFRDVIIVPPLANITIRFLNHKFLGEVVMHCHLLNHEDTGMMMTTEIVNLGENLTANTLSGTAAPGQCNECDPFPFNANTSGCIPSSQASTHAIGQTSVTLIVLLAVLRFAIVI